MGDNILVFSILPTLLSATCRGNLAYLQSRLVGARCAKLTQCARSRMHTFSLFPCLSKTVPTPPAITLRGDLEVSNDFIITFVLVHNLSQSPVGGMMLAAKTSLDISCDLHCCQTCSLSQLVFAHFQSCHDARERERGMDYLLIKVV